MTAMQRPRRTVFDARQGLDNRLGIQAIGALQHGCVVGKDDRGFRQLPPSEVTLQEDDGQHLWFETLWGGCKIYETLTHRVKVHLSNYCT